LWHLDEERLRWLEDLTQMVDNWLFNRSCKFIKIHILFRLEKFLWTYRLQRKRFYQSRFRHFRLTRTNGDRIILGKMTATAIVCYNCDAISRKSDVYISRNIIYIILAYNCYLDIILLCDRLIMKCAEMKLYAHHCKLIPVPVMLITIVIFSR